MKMNILLITIDSLRADFAKCCINEAKNNNDMPNLSNFAQQSIIFKNAFSNAPYTGASLATLFTSKYPGMVISPNNTLLKNSLTIADILQTNRYVTLGIHSNPFLSTNFKFDKGFSYFEDNLLPWNKDAIPKRYQIMANKIVRLFRKQPYLPAMVINKKAFYHLKNIAHPFFLWIHYMDTHGPYQSKKGFSYLNKYKAEILWRKAVKKPHQIAERELISLISAYKEEIKYVDYCLKEFFAALDRLDLLQNTIIVICSDHGEAFCEHGTFSHPRQLYEELIKVPLIVKFPDIEKKIMISQPVALIDIVPTLLDYLGISLKEYSFVGNSLLPLIKNENDKNFRQWVISDATPDKEYYNICIRTNEWKLIINELNEKKELYNLIKDPKEQLDLINSEQEIAKKLEKELLAHRKKMKAKIQNYEDEKPSIDREMQKRLSSLGYL